MFKGIIRKADILLAGVLILTGVAASLWISQFDTSGSRVIIKTDGKVYGSYSISEDRTVTVKQGKKNQHGSNSQRGGFRYPRKLSQPGMRQA